ncbi:hypothetical protein IFO70_14675 [Phormidium tenue FACHB-886]|nr:hypothetical protein [Phormidium tenue FACHB-886]
MADQEKSAGNGEATKTNKLELSDKPAPNGQANGQTKAEPAGLALRSEPQAPASIELAGVRPIGSSHLDIYATFLNNRPIMASHLQVMEYVGSRPIFASDLVIREDFAGRPVVASNPKLMESSTLPGGRPIASNEIDDGEMLMGFID